MILGGMPNNKIISWIFKVSFLKHDLFKKGCMLSNILYDFLNAFFFYKKKENSCWLQVRQCRVKILL